MHAKGKVNHTPAMRSPVYWAVLGLVIERPSYGYELLRRFEREYGQMLPLSSGSHVYRALNVLQERGLIEEILATVNGAPAGRQPRPRYEVTMGGLRGYRDWLIARVRQEHRPSRLFARELAAFASEPDVALEIIDCCEQACASEPGSGAHATAGREGDAAGLAARLLSEESRLTMQATLPWVRYARSEFEALAARKRTAPGGQGAAALDAHGTRKRRGALKAAGRGARVRRAPDEAQAKSAVLKK